MAILICAFISLVIGRNYAVSALCRFAPELQNDVSDPTDLWQTIRNGGHATYRFTEDKLTITAMADGREDGVMNAVCLENHAGNLYLMHPDLSVPDVNMNFCLHCEFITPSIAHCSTGGRPMTDMTGDKPRCTKADHEKMDQPLVSSRLREDFNGTTCPFKSAYSFRASLHTGDTATGLCSRKPSPGILEMQCHKGEGIKFHFPSDHCFPINSAESWKPIYEGDHLRCLGSWVTNQYSYAILTDSKMKPRWCMTHALQPSAKFTILIYDRAVCPLPENQLSGSEAILELVVDKLHEHTHCVDDISCDVTMCQLKTYKHVCQRTCGVCGDSAPSCEFDEKFIPLGRWSLDETTTSASVTITRHQIQEVNGSTLTCDTKMDGRTYIVRAHSRDSCPARKICVKFDDSRNSILHYQKTQFIPLTSDDVIEACSERWFTKQPVLKLHMMHETVNKTDSVHERRGALAGFIIGSLLATACIMLCIFGVTMLTKQHRRRRHTLDSVPAGATAYVYKAEYDKLQNVSQNGSQNISHDGSQNVGDV